MYVIGVGAFGSVCVCRGLMGSLCLFESIGMVFLIVMGAGGDEDAIFRCKTAH